MSTPPPPDDPVPPLPSLPPGPPDQPAPPADIVLTPPLQPDLEPQPGDTHPTPPAPPTDPWAHRRGEPRVLAFFWTLYVLLAVAGSVTWVARVATVTPDSYAPAARIMLVVLAVGATVLWPMTRLCQVPPGLASSGSGPPEPDPVRATWADVFAILLPLYMTVWPMYFLASWPLGIVVGVVAVLTGWVLLIGGLLALGLVLLLDRATRAPLPPSPSPDPRAPGLRTLLMTLILVLVLAAPAALLTRPVSPPAWLPMLSPLTAVATITGRGLLGPQHPVLPVQWAVIALIWLLAVALWGLAWARGLFVQPPRPA